MLNETKLLCNVCFNPLTVTHYKEGLYIDICDCTYDEIYNEGKEDGDREGFERGHEEGEYYGIDRGRDEAENELREEMRELEEKLEKYSALIEDEEYLERLGT